MIGILIAAAVSVWVLFQLPLPHERTLPEEGTHQVFLGHNGVHIDFVFSRREFFEFMPGDWRDANQFAPDKSWVAMGWGDSDFLLHHPTWDTVGFGDIMTAAFASKKSALRLTFDDQPWGYEKAELRLDDARFKLLLSEIDRGAQRNADGKPLLLHYDREKGEALFVSPLSYSAFYTCNDWTAGILRRLDLPAPWLVSTSSSIMRYYKKD